MMKAKKAVQKKMLKAMNKTNNVVLLVFFFLIAIPFSLGEPGHMKLLAVSETENGYIGGTADLYLDIKPGSGRIFLETFPFTKVDTQMSTRFANEIACDYVDADCSQHDFFYTLNANSAIIGGPSAGAAIATLTVAMLQGYTGDELVAVTGTINAGGLIGPVGGLKEKVSAGSKVGLKTILVPKGESLFTNESERKVMEAVEEKGVDVVEVYTLDEAVYHFTGKSVKKQRQLEIDMEYAETMHSLGEQLCGRTKGLAENVDDAKIEESNRTVRGRELALNLSNKGKTALEEGAYYAAASYCFGANVEYSKLLLGVEMEDEGQEGMIRELSREIDAFEEKIESSPIKTITDLESYMISTERAQEAKEFVKDAGNATSAEGKAAALAWGNERLYSAESWFQFFGKAGRQYSIDESSLATSCALKMAEAEERIQYLELFLPVALSTARAELEEAEKESDAGNYELCLFKASKAKASVGVVLGVFGVKQELYPDVLEVKLDIVKQMIAEQTEEGVFPILGYSYYEYASSLKQDDVLSALLYAEYALELGNLDMYFSQKNGGKSSVPAIDKKMLVVFLIGAIIGGLSVLTVRRKTDGKTAAKATIKPKRK